MRNLRRLGLLLMVYTLTALVSPGSSIVNPRPKPTYKPDFVFPSVPEHDRRRLPVWGLSLYDHSTGSSNQRLKREMQPKSSVFELESQAKSSQGKDYSQKP
ncbi:GL26455 [Drosophila persimilis]|uniref:GL26455 n=1 Tax=Drosophila persimilis TaxID=7234 RepID=B4GSM8_DROPE|nr:uncharacterized protein LOC6596391 isoform X1 [Drosophila persimilis]EDW25387.1 GL26455 [Drosophila persimilis]